MTFAQTQDILNNVNVESLVPNEICKVCCLRDGWHYLFDNLDKEDNLIFLEEINKYTNVTERAIKSGLWIMRCQPFKDGNKRVGSFAINKILIQNGLGIFNVPVNKGGIFKEKS